MTTGEPRQRPETVTILGETYRLDYDSSPPGSIPFTKNSSIFRILDELHEGRHEMARPRRMETEAMELTPDSSRDDLSALVSEFAQAVDLIAAKTLWHTRDRPYLPLLAAANALVALGEMLVAAQVIPASNGTENAAEGRARALVTQCLYTPAGRNRSLWMPDHHLSALLALVMLAYRSALHGDDAPMAEARTAVAELVKWGQRGR